jgi:hypothetical protein
MKHLADWCSKSFRKIKNLSKIGVGKSCTREKSKIMKSEETTGKEINTSLMENHLVLDAGCVRGQFEHCQTFCGLAA